MKDEAIGQLRPGKGTRIAVSGGVLRKLADALQQAADLYDNADTPEEFMRLLELDDQSNTEYNRGGKDFAAFNKFLIVNTGAGEQFRVTFSLNDHKQFTLDFRGWWTG